MKIKVCCNFNVCLQRTSIANVRFHLNFTEKSSNRIAELEQNLSTLNKNLNDVKAEVNEFKVKV